MKILEFDYQNFNRISFIQIIIKHYFIYMNVFIIYKDIKYYL